MTIRRATPDDVQLLRELYDAFRIELSEPEHLWRPWDAIEDEVGRRVGDGLVLLAETDGEATGFAFLKLESPQLGWVGALYVRPDARRRGIAKALLREAGTRLREEGADHLALEVGAGNADALVVYRRLGFVDAARVLTVQLDELDRRIEARPEEPSFASTHVQTDDRVSVERAVTQFLPRLGRTARSEVTETRNGWITVYDDLCDRDRSAQRRFAGEVSERLGAVVVALAVEEGAVVRFLLFERGRMVDEYLSVPTYYGPLNRADELSLGANPTLASRLTGADPALVRSVIRIASSPAELPPARELYVQVAGVLGVEARIER